MSSRILIVEDEPLLAFDLAQHVGEAGFAVVGPASSVQAALSLIEREGCDAAVLDVNLGRETAEPVALALKSRGTPFVILSGYSRAQHPLGFAGAPALTKPARPAELVAILRGFAKGNHPAK